jgi:hypothetical protein
LPAVHAQIVDQNIGRPLRKILSYRCSTTLVFKVWWGSIEIFGDFRSQSSATGTSDGDMAERPRAQRAGALSRALPRGAFVPHRPGPPRRRASRGVHAEATRASSGLEARAWPRVDHAVRAALAPCPR